MQKHLSLSRSHWVLFLFPLFWEMDWKRYCCSFWQRVLSMFSSRNFIVSSLTLMYLIHFKLIFVYDVKEWSNFIFLHAAVQFSPVVEETVFPILCSFASFLHRLTIAVWVYFWVFYLVPLDLYLCFCGKITLFWWLEFCCCSQGAWLLQLHTQK